MGNDSVDFTLVGTGLGDVDDVYLYSSDHYKYNLSADIDSATDTKIKGTLDLTDGEEDTYKVCVKDSRRTVFCDLSYEVLTDQVGKLDISSSPTGATVLLDGTSKGTTPLVLKDVSVGSHKILLTKSGYQDWGKTTTVNSGETTNIDVTLYAAATATPATTSPPAIPTSRPTTARTTAKSTIKVPTTWPDTPAPTTASPVDPAVIIGTLGLAVIALRKH